MIDLGAVHFVVLIPVAWCFLSWLLAHLSGWSLLAKQYSASEPVDGESARMRSGRLGVINYHSCLSFRANDDGLRIAAPFFLRLGHAPLFIPWDEFHQVTGDPLLYSHKVRAVIGRPTLVRVILPGWVRYRMPLEMRPPNAAIRQ